jgi:ribose-phosphate pyrophosphokinase
MRGRIAEPNDPATTRYVAALFEAIGYDAVVTLEVRNETAYENAFRCRAVALTAAPLLIDAIKPFAGGEPVCVISPDL